MGPASSQEPSGAAGERYYEYPHAADPGIQQGPPWASQPAIAPNMRDFSCPAASTMTNEAAEIYPLYPARCDNILPSLPSHVAEHVDLDLESPALQHCSRLHYAIIRGDIDLATTLLKRGEDPSPVAFGGITPLHCAVFKRDIGLVKLLRRHKARLETVTEQ